MDDAPELALPQELKTPMKKYAAVRWSGWDP
jgi:hypothetical protein